MEVEDVSPALRERLGPDATVGLLALLESSRKDWAQDVTNQAVERFERELTRQIGGFREEMRQSITSLRADLREVEATLRAEMRDGDAALRLEMREGDAAIRLEMREGDAAIRLEMRDQRVELLKWSFAFWVAQFVSVGGLMAILLRSFLPNSP
jgi:hypothetical protein